MSGKAKVLTALAAVIVVAVAGFFAMRMFMAAPDDLDLSRAKASVNGLYQLAIEPEAEPVQQGTLHAWIVTLKTSGGEPVIGARLTVGGGMPQHGHGLPTQPQASDIGDGRYRVEGVRFNMSGWWVLKLGVEGPAGNDEAEFNLVL